MGGKLLIGGGLVLGIAGLVLLARRSSASSPAAAVPSWRQELVGCVLGHADVGTLYQWGGGHGHGGFDWGLDCSGLVNVCAAQVALDVAGNSDWYYQHLPPTAEPLPGDLALYGTPERATHVRVVTAWYPEQGRAEAVGSEGGGSTTTTPEAAIAQGAMVRRVQDHRKFGAQFLGFRSMEPYGRTVGMGSRASMRTPPG